MGNKKIIASFELSLIIISAFAFPYMIAGNSEIFEEFDEEYEEVLVKNSVSKDMQAGGISLENVIVLLLKELKEPMIPVVSAADDPLDDVGCCEYASDKSRCATTSEAYCDVGSGEEEGFFEKDKLCSEYASCNRGCCYNTNTGVYEKNVLNDSCSFEWDTSDNCNIDGAEDGCCIIGTRFEYNTEKECEILAKGESYDWNSDLNDGECELKLRTYGEGACVFTSGDCKFRTEEDCIGGTFYEGYLCTHSDLDTWCEIPTNAKTKCHGDKDGVYFLDSCDNYANVYDYDNRSNQDYWNEVIESKDSCGGDSTTGNANSLICGNCDRFVGGICSSTAVEDGINVKTGNNYCRTTLCSYTHKGDSSPTIYKAGDSWCVYDGVVGGGNDTVGSRHWKYTCNYGVVEEDACKDYRNEVCIESTDKIASCVTNNWRTCIYLNTEEDGITTCEETTGCFVHTVHVDSPDDEDEDGDEAEYFKFDVCVPEYPGGFDLTVPVQASKAVLNCGMASLSCPVIRGPKAFGSLFDRGCKYYANEECLSVEFAEEMNDLCMRMGDCGMETNYAGIVSENYVVSWNHTEDVDDTIEPRIDNSIGSSYLVALKLFATSANTHIVEIDYMDDLEASGLLDFSIDDYGEVDYGSMALPVGLGGLALSASSYLVGSFIKSGFEFALGVGPLGAGFTSFFGAVAGAALGAYGGYKLAKLLGWNDVSTILLTTAGLALGAGAGWTATLLIMGAGSNAWNPLGWFALAALILALTAWIISLFDDSCESIEVSFECKPWKAPSGGDNCELCNDDSLKPCSKYRCASLGAACYMRTDGDGPDVCVSDDDDLTRVVLNPLLEVISSGVEYHSVVEDKGVSLKPTGDEDCFEPYTDLIFGVNTSKRAYCKYSTEMEDFDEMDLYFGVNGWFYDHAFFYSLPDLSGGQSQEEGATRDLTLYVRCKDTYERENSEPYQISMCINEGPDITGPFYEAISPANNDFIGIDTLKKDIKIVTHEPADCRWDFNDVSYIEMDNSMSCSTTHEYALGVTGYVCDGELNTTRDDLLYYIRCMDQPWLETSYDDRNDRRLKYELQRPDSRIEIEWIKPYEDVKISTDRISVDLEVKTSGGGENHRCKYSFSGYENMILMWPPENGIHTQAELNLGIKTHIIRINCSDETGDVASDNVTFKVEEHDKSIPELTRVWQAGSLLHVVTDKISECRYSTDGCSYSWDGEGVESASGSGEDHTINVVAGKTYYIKCKTEHSTLPSGCLVQVQAV